MNWLTRLHLRDTLLIIGVLPAAVLSLVLSLYFTQTIISDIEKNLQNQGTSLATHLANASVFGVFTMNIEQLEALIEISTQNPDVLAVKILDSSDRVIVQSPPPPPSKGQKKIRSRDFQVSIHSGGFSPQDDVGELLMSNAPPDPNVLGSVILTLSTERSSAHEVAVKRNSFYITLVSLLIIAVVAARMSRIISAPLLRTTADVQRIAAGDYRPTAPIKAQNELGTLSSGIHSMAKQLESHHKDLEMKIQLATKQLESQNHDLQQARQLAEEASELKSRFLAQMSHEIRTPMNGIMGFLDMLRSTELDQQQRLYLDTAQKSSKNLLRIINEVLDLSRLEAGRAEIVPSTFDLENTIQECLDLIALQAKQRFVTITLNLSPGLPTRIHQDPVRLSQVLINLLGNAIKFSYQSEVVLTVRPAERQPGSQILFSISDEGAGIHPRDLPYLFDPFTQFNSNKMQQGSGLGLAISKQIIDTLGGNIGVGSTLNVGSTFWFTLPYGPPQEDAALPAKQSLPDVDLSGKRILVADDNEINRQLLTLMLQQRGAAVDQAVDGQDAVNQCKLRQYDLLMIDIIMPKQSGTEALQAIRSDVDNHNHSTPAIAITALSTAELQEELMAARFQNCLTKPIFDQELGKILSPYFPNTSSPVATVAADRTYQPQADQNAALDFDIERALQQMNGNHNLVRTMLDKLRAELPQQLSDIDRLIQGNQLKAAHEIAHKIHGSAAYCGTTRLKLASESLEMALMGTDQDLVLLYYNELKDCINRLLES